MCRNDTIRILSGIALATLMATAQADAPAWRPLGNAAMRIGAPGLATGGVRAVRWLPEARLYVETDAGRPWVWSEARGWASSEAARPEANRIALPAEVFPPEPGAVLRAAASRGVLYAGLRHVWRSEDNGQTWMVMTELRGRSLLGGDVRDIAVSPSDPEQLVVATASGLWSSMDGGRSWASLNEGLPALTARRMLALPDGRRGMRLQLSDGRQLQWQPGERSGWSLAEEAVPVAAAELEGFAAPAVSSALLRVERNAADANFALALTADKLLRTLNRGLTWEVLADGAERRSRFGGMAFDAESGTIYLATERGLLAGRNAGDWSAPGGLPAAEVLDVRLGADNHLLYALTEGYGVFVATAPHRRITPRAVAAADLANHPAAPGSLLTLLGVSPSATVTVDGQSATVLNAGAADASADTQIQLPFSLRSGEHALRVGPSNDLRVNVAEVAPVLFQDADGAPVLFDAASGMPIDLSNPARPGSSVQILLSGLGRVRPDWPAGLPAPAENAPKVAAELRVSISGQELTPSRAILAPGYVGFYLVEFTLPQILNQGWQDLRVVASGRSSQALRFFVDLSR
jgi:uncharacterized protein (TIGR03437 family)